MTIQHNVEGLLRGDQKTRYEAYRVGKEWSWLSSNDIRTQENLSTIPDGNGYRQPMNSEPLGTDNQPAE